MSCTTSKKAMSSKHTAELTHDYEQTDQVQENWFAKYSSTQLQQRHLTSEIVERRESDEEVTTTIYEYDTDKAIDPVTGKPPLIRELTQTRKKKDTGTQQQKAMEAETKESEADGEAIVNREEYSTAQGKIQGEFEEQSSEKTSRTLSAQKFFCWLLGVFLIILVGVRWYTKKYL